MKTAEHKLNIISRSDEPFIDRIKAGDLLADALGHFKGPQTVVLGVPRGGLVVARQVAHKLKVPFDIVLSRKLGAPQNPELAIGSISETGEVYLDQDLAQRVGADEDYLRGERESQFAEIQRRRKVYRRVCPKIDLRNKIVIVTDDGIATGATVQSAFKSIRQEKPRKLIGAFPVGPEDTLKRLSMLADEIICLKAPSFLEGVGQFYFNFGQVSEEEVLNILKECRESS
ncbi:MAG: phosphoribosyltransferase family protein [Candidatus Omnitrophica bacterium]|nr:phosphoribosyltransferase family protein [Candidatus Omnitrophota bacterium]